MYATQLSTGNTRSSYTKLHTRVKCLNCPVVTAPRPLVPTNYFENIHEIITRMLFISVNSALACSLTRRLCILIYKSICNSQKPIFIVALSWKRTNCRFLFFRQGKQFSCDRCGKEFQTKVQLQTHNRSVHSDLRPFSCRFCDKTFKSKLTLRQHERIHTGERPYQCPHCSKAFRQDVHLVNHIRLHTGEKPFVCTYCNKAFAHKNNLSIHVKIHTGAKNMCSVCGQVFRSIVKLRLHEGIHTPLSVPTTEGDIAEETL